MKKFLTYKYYLPMALPVLGLFLTLASPCWCEEMRVSGFTEAAQNSALGLAAKGRIMEISVEEGAVVEKGQVLLELDHDIERLEVRRRKLLWQNKAEINSLKKQVKTLKKQLQATRQLFNSTGSVPQEELENKELELAFAAAELDRLKIAEERELIEYETAREQLARRFLRAPFDGQVAEILVETGENCDTDTELVRLVGRGELNNFVANFELKLSQQLRLGDKVTLLFDSGLTTIRKPAEISFISPLVDPASGLRKIKAKFENPGGEVVPGIAGLMILETESLAGKKDPVPSETQ